MLEEVLCQFFLFSRHGCDGNTIEYHFSFHVMNQEQNSQIQHRLASGPRLNDERDTSDASLSSLFPVTKPRTTSKR